MTAIVEERLDRVFHGLTLLMGGLEVQAGNISLNAADVKEALVPLARDLREEVYWVRVALADDVLNQEAPDADEREARVDVKVTGGAR